MELGFETIGNAVLVCHDRRPVLVTDPWTEGSAYFGSWTRSHAIPPDVMASIKACPYVWISHGHPDHFSPRSLGLLGPKKVLLPDHVGGVIRDGLIERGFEVIVLRDCRWMQLSDRIRIMSIADYNQDAVLLVDIGGRLIVNMNDADDHGWGTFVSKIIRRYDVSFMLHLAGFGDSDMINLYREDGTFIVPRAEKARPVGRSMANWAGQWGTKFTVPFSSMHVYQRADSIWASRYTTRLSDYQTGWDAKRAELLPAFIRYDAIRDSVEQINPAFTSPGSLNPETFGDCWAEPMEAEDKPKISVYFRAISHLEKAFDFIRVRIGSIEHVVELNSQRFARGLTFEAPRHSFMTSINYGIFDDLLIGNFMKVTINGELSARPLYPHFTPYVTKYADNGMARTKPELTNYFAAYCERYPFGYLRHRLETKVVQAVRHHLEEDGSLYNIGARSYHWIKSLRSGNSK
jgi:hypothetical protein